MTKKLWLTLNDISLADPSLDEEESVRLMVELKNNSSNWFFYPGVSDEVALSFINDQSYIGSREKFMIHQHKTPVHVFRCSKTDPSFEGLVYTNGAVAVLRREQKYLIYLWVDKQTKILFNYPDPQIVKSFVAEDVERFLRNEDSFSG